MSEGKILICEKLPKKEGAAITFDKVLFYSDGKKTEVGKPLVKSVKVTGKILSQFKAKKVMVIKFKHKTRYRRKRGHRQQQTRVKIEKIGATK